MRVLTALLAGVLFGSGLLVSGMTNPATVLAFLDVGGTWNPALALTMGGAILVAAPAYYRARRRGRTVDGQSVELPKGPAVNARLLVGAAVFGIGWGMSGICPGPALVLLAGSSAQALAFVLAMLTGMVISGR